MEGKTFSKWTVLKLMPSNGKGKYYECQCECGTIAVKAGTELRANRSKQCKECGYAELYDPQREIGNKYGKWTIVEFIGMHRKLQHFRIKCECGNESMQAATELRGGRTTQCTKCCGLERGIRMTQHGRHKDPVYSIWRSMIDRCTNPKTEKYSRYGGRGIKVCDRWRKFINFIADMGERPDGLTIDRIDNNGNYEPGNCRWVTHKENCNNRYYDKSDVK
jgi:hypothetical protein